MNDELKAQKKKTPMIVKRNNELIKELDDILQLIWCVCWNEWSW